ncbi:glycine zipper family protein [Pseudorhodobacter sp. MZDSW-24AT]|nr:glycine zipper family protein [Pseudorhodobacter sp. MZDSW-24AT]
MLLKRLFTFVFISALAGCVQEPLTEYRPVVDPAKSSPAKFERDLAACRNVGLSAEAAYKQRQEKEMAQKMMAGILLGAIAGAAVGDSSTAAAGAAYGAGAGAAATDTELAQGGPRRIIDRCMADRGHTVLNDIGRG